MTAPSSVGGPDGTESPRGAARRHWIRWAMLGLVGAVIVFLIVSVVLTFRGRARPVSMSEATSRYHPSEGSETGPHPSPGVYVYTGSGTDRVRLPPLAQPEGPTLPGTVELVKQGCWDFRMDFSTNHWGELDLLPASGWPRGGCRAGLAALDGRPRRAHESHHHALRPRDDGPAHRADPGTDLGRALRRGIHRGEGQGGASRHLSGSSVSPC